MYMFYKTKEIMVMVGYISRLLIYARISAADFETYFSAAAAAVVVIVIIFIIIVVVGWLW